MGKIADAPDVEKHEEALLADLDELWGRFQSRIGQQGLLEGPGLPILGGHRQPHAKVVGLASVIQPVKPVPCMPHLEGSNLLPNAFSLFNWSRVSEQWLLARPDFSALGGHR